MPATDAAVSQTGASGGIWAIAASGFRADLWLDFTPGSFISYYPVSSTCFSLMLRKSAFLGFDTFDHK